MAANECGWRWSSSRNGEMNERGARTAQRQQDCQWNCMQVEDEPRGPKTGHADVCGYTVSPQETSSCNPALGDIVKINQNSKPRGCISISASGKGQGFTGFTSEKSATWKPPWVTLRMGWGPSQVGSSWYALVLVVYYRCKKKFYICFLKGDGCIETVDACETSEVPLFLQVLLEPRLHCYPGHYLFFSIHIYVD